MGWASMLEDAVRRFEEALHDLQNELGEKPATTIPAGQQRAIRDLISRGEKILFEALTHLDLATDPSLNTAAELRSAMKEREKLEAELDQYKKTCLSLRRNLDKERERADRLKRELDASKIEKNRLERKLEEIMANNPSAVYDAFSKGTPR